MKRLDIYPARPFIKWVGGKTQLLDDIKKILPRDLSRRDEMTYIEPFVGGRSSIVLDFTRIPKHNKGYYK